MSALPLGLLLVLLLAVGWQLPRLGDPWFAAIGRFVARLARRKGTALILVFSVAIILRVAIMVVLPVPIPSIHDEFSYLLQADTFVHGRLTNPPHPMWIYLDTFHELQHPTYSSIFPPGQGAVLALGQLLGHPWIGVLVSMAAMCAAMTWLMQGWLRPQWALWGAVLIVLRIYLFKYWLESYWGGAVAAIGGALVLGAYPRITKHQRTRDALLMAIGMAILANSRPLEGFLFCIPITASLLIWLKSARSPAFSITGPRIVLPILSVLGITLAFILYDNWRVTHNPFLFPHALYDQQYINYRVFHWQRLRPPLQYLNPQFEEYFNHWVRDTFAPNWSLLWNELLSWWTFFVGIFFAVPLIALPATLRDQRIRLPVIVFFWCLACLVPVFFFEPHYAAPMSGAFFIILVQSMRYLRLWRVKDRPVGLFLTRLVVVVIITWTCVLTVELHGHGLHGWAVDRFTMVKQLESLPGKHLVIVHYEPDHDVHHEWVYNGADIDGSKIVWAREIPGRDLRPLLDYFRDRTVWEVEVDSTTPILERYPSHGQDNPAANGNEH